MIFNFDYWDTNLGREQFQIGYSTSDDAPASFTWEASTTSSATIQNYETVVPANTKYVAIKYISNDKLYLYLDNFSIQAIPTEPTISISQGSLDFGAVGIGTAKNLALPVTAYSLDADITISTTSPFTVSTDNITFSPTATITHSNPVTEGLLYVKFQPTTSGNINESITLTSTGASTVQLNAMGSGIECSSISQLPWSENFEGATFPPLCWEIAGTTPESTWAPYVYGSTWASCLGHADDRVERLITPSLDFTNFTDSITLAFDFISFYAYIENGYVDLNIYASADGGNTFTSTSLWSLSEVDEFNNRQSTHATVDISSLAGQSDVKFSFSYEGAVCQILFDNVLVYHGDSPVSVAEINRPQASVFPNPAKDQLHIQANAQLYRVDVFNMAGQCIAMQDLSGTNAQLNTSHWAPGIYMLNIQTPQGVIHQKVVIAQ